MKLGIKKIPKRKLIKIVKSFKPFSIQWNVWGWDKDIPIVEKVIKEEVEKLGLNIANRLVNEYGHRLDDYKLIRSINYTDAE